MSLLIMPNKMITYFSLIMLFMTGFNCSGGDGDNVVYYYQNCGNVESNADLLNSIEKVEELLKKANITVKKGIGDYDCGYKLVMSDKEKFVEGAMTDIDLILLAEEFFDLKILDE